MRIERKDAHEFGGAQLVTHPQTFADPAPMSVTLEFLTWVRAA
jgi:hypothetical protein